jgi:thiol-disulfide isomerase/thioredoxin
MARTPSTMLMALGAPAPHFELPDAAGHRVSLAGYRGKPLLVMFICNHCPYVKHLREGIAAFARDYGPRGLGIVAINSNDAEQYPDDSPAAMAAEAKAAGYTFPYLVDESQEVAQAYQAACTPDFFLFDAGHRLAYRGQFDGSRPQNGAPVSGADLRRATDAVLAGETPATEQRASLGCNIKWKAGNAPAYFAPR